MGCLDCKSFVNGEEPECLKKCIDFIKQLVSGQTIPCKEMEEK